MIEEVEKIVDPSSEEISPVGNVAGSSDNTSGQKINTDVITTDGFTGDVIEVMVDEEEVGKKTKGPKARAKKKPVIMFRELDEVRAAYPWFAVHTYSGFEMRVKVSIEEQAKVLGLEQKFGNILVPQETVVELVKGQKRTSTRKFFPGYIVVQMELCEDTWHLVKETPKVTGFLGDAKNPSPLSREEVAKLLEQLRGGGAKPKPRVSFEIGDSVKVIDGPFADFNATVDEVKTDKGKLRVLISIFGRNTPVELDFVQVEKV